MNHNSIKRAFEDAKAVIDGTRVVCDQQAKDVIQLVGELQHVEHARQVLEAQLAEARVTPSKPQRYASSFNEVFKDVFKTEGS